MKTKNKLKPIALLIGIAMATNAIGQTSGYVGRGNGTIFVNTTTPIFEDATNHRIGIGTTTPGYKLDVNGNINIASGSTLMIGGSSLTKAGGYNPANDFFGEYAGLYASGGLNNCGYGYSAGWYLGGARNTALGQWSAGANTGGSDNTIGGFQSGYYSGSGNDNTIFGSYSGYGVYNASPTSQM